MINFVTTRDHAYTVRSIIAELGRTRCQCWHYESLFVRKTLPLGTWILTDHDRLSSFELSRAGRIAARLEQAGATVLNRPASALQRYQLLAALKQKGINGFAAYRAEASPRPASFPVFIRNEYDHGLKKAELLRDQSALETELQELKQRGMPLAGKLVIEYAGQEEPRGIWRRYAAYRVGEEIIAHHCAFDSSWLVKNGFSAEQLERNPSRDVLLGVEREFIFDNRHEDCLRTVFQIAGVEYGRADFAVIDGKPQIFEINSNPNHMSRQKLLKIIHPRRLEQQRHSEDALYQAMSRLDTDGNSPVEFKLTSPRRRTFWNRLTGRLPRP